MSRNGVLMATATYPDGRTVEFDGSAVLVTYYEAEGATVEQSAAAVPPEFPVVFEDGVQVSAGSGAGEALGEAAGAAAEGSQELADTTAGLAAAVAEVLPEGQYRANDGIVYDASGAAVDPQPEPPAA